MLFIFCELNAKELLGFEKDHGDQGRGYHLRNHEGDEVAFRVANIVAFCSLPTTDSDLLISPISCILSTMVICFLQKLTKAGVIYMERCADDVVK
uniref:Uncharacterized protein n=1 Tax=Solanum lycopersicum TaxID=4081 RepID=A0A3Q7ISH7_SOLLC